MQKTRRIGLKLTGLEKYKMKAPFPYFGSKSKIADRVWAALGQPKHYIEPFFGSGAVLLNRPDWVPIMTETVCDKDGHLANVWRALQFAPDSVARICDWPVNHADLIARRKTLIERQDDLLDALCRDDKFFDVELAGYWIWAASCWIGQGLTRINAMPHVSNAGKGVHAKGQIPHVSDAGKGVQEPYNVNIYTWFRQLSERLRYVRVVCGDWSRVCGGNWQDKMGNVGVFLDPPYSHDAGRDNNLYAVEDDCAKAVAKWAHERGRRPTYRIVLAGYDGEHNWLESEGWRVILWKARGGYSNLGKTNLNRHRERLWLSPHCLKGE